MYPRFVGCENQNLADSILIKCSEEAFLNYLYKNITPPKKNYKKNFKGKAIVEFGIDEDGKVIRTIIKKIKRTDKYQRKQEAEYGKVLLQVINEMPNWIINESIIKPLYPHFTVSANFQSGSLFIEVDRKQSNVYWIEDLKKERAEYYKRRKEKEKKRQEELRKARLSKDTSIIVEEIPLFVVIPYVPRFPGCEGLGYSFDELQKCSENEMMKYIYGNVKRPPEVRLSNTTQVKVTVQFIVFNNGSIGHIEVLEDSGDGWGKEVQKVINQMNDMQKKWTLGPSRGEAINTKFTFTFEPQFNFNKKNK